MDDQLLIRCVIEKILERDYEVIGFVAYGRELINTVAVLKPAVAIVEISLPIMNGIEAWQSGRCSDVPAVEAVEVQAGGQMSPAAGQQKTTVLEGSSSGKPSLCTLLNAGSLHAQILRGKEVFHAKL